MNSLGIDVGTGGTRAVVIDPDGNVVASATAEHVPFISARTGWAEQDPEDWWQATITVVRKVLSKSSGDEIKAVGFSGQMHGLVLLDQSDEVLRPAIIWCDQRTDSQCKSLTEMIGADRLIELTCNPALTGFTLPKMLWVRESEPDLWRRLRTVLLPKDYVRLKLSGDRATDVADASGTLLFDVKTRRWSTEMLSATEIDERLLPRVYESPEVTGVISKAGAEATGLRAGTPIIAGGGDQAAGAVGMGIVRPGTASSTIGTSGVVFAATDKPMLDPKGRVHTFCHAIPGRWHVMGVTQGAGLSLRWFRDQFGAIGADDCDSYDSLTKEASLVSSGSNGLIWTPYLMGERTPHLDPFARAALDEAKLVACVTASVVEKGGTVATKAQDGMTIYAVGGDTPLAFSFGAPDTLIVAQREALVVAARDQLYGDKFRLMCTGKPLTRSSRKKARLLVRPS